jgi:hypothetical protein
LPVYQWVNSQFAPVRSLQNPASSLVPQIHEYGLTFPEIGHCAEPTSEILDCGFQRKFFSAFWHSKLSERRRVNATNNPENGRFKQRLCPPQNNSPLFCGGFFIASYQLSAVSSQLGY